MNQTLDLIEELTKRHLNNIKSSEKINKHMKCYMMNDIINKYLVSMKDDLIKNSNIENKCIDRYAKYINKNNIYISSSNIPFNAIEYNSEIINIINRTESIIKEFKKNIEKYCE